MKTLISTVLGGADLSESQMAGAVEAMFAGEVTDSQIAALLTALRMKGEAEEEVSGAAIALRRRAVSVPVPDDGCLIDIVGTGGDAFGTFNISTTAAFVLAAAGVRVAKHGNRAVSSKCGSADVLTELGVTVDIPPERVRECIERVGIGFLYAPLLNPAMRSVASVRRDLGFPTLFNIAGPLANPARTRRALVGVFRRGLTRPLAGVLGRLGAVRAVVVHGEDGLDEITITSHTHVAEWRGGHVEEYTLSPEDMGLQRAPLSCILGGDARRNARLVEAVLDGERGPRRDVVLMNAAVALRVAEVCPDLADGIRVASRAIDSGRAMEKLVQLRQVSS